MAKSKFDDDDCAGNGKDHVFSPEHPPKPEEGGSFVFSDEEFYNRVLDAACTFVPVKRAAKLFFMSDAEFDKRCRKVFHGMPSRDVFDFCANKADIECRKRINELAYNGNKSALEIWTKYIDRIQKEEANDAMKIAIVSLPKASEIASGKDGHSGDESTGNGGNEGNAGNNDGNEDDDGGVHLE